jgi:hypothetical protein
MNARSPRYSTLGRPRSLTDAQVAEILAWRNQRMTLAQKAHSLGIPLTTLQYILTSRGANYASRTSGMPRCGRPRTITDALIADVLAWDAKRLTRAQLADRMGISFWAVGHVITQRGIFKQPSPELRSEYRIQDRQHRDRLRAAHLL